LNTNSRHKQFANWNTPTTSIREIKLAREEEEEEEE
jgi:hypothetical protein